MKKLFSILLLSTSLSLFAQGDCNTSVETTEEGIEIITTKDYLMFERVFGNSTQFIFFSLTNSDGVPILNFQHLTKSTDFPKIHCLDENSRIYFQLTNGKIITLLSAQEEHCASMLYDGEEKKNISILTSSFVFTKGTLEELEKSPISLMRVKYSTETVDYTIKKKITGESVEGTFFPENYFINNLKCIK